MRRIGAIVGPTGSGKSALAMDVAGPGTEIISVDSMQVYREMDIGTAKPSVADRQLVTHHLIDLVDPSQEFSVAEFQAHGRREMEGIPGKALVVGGSGLHFRALVDPLEFPPTDARLRTELEVLDSDELTARLLELDPGASEIVDLANRRRVIRALEVTQLIGETPSQRAAGATAQAVSSYEGLYETTIVGIDPGEALEARIIDRVDAMLAAGWLEEAAELDGRLGTTAGAAIGYTELIAVAKGERALEDARDDIISATRALAKRQRTFFRRDPRVRWLPWLGSHEERVAAVSRVLEEAQWSS